MNDSRKVIEELKTEITSLKIRLRRVESFIEAMPNPEEYIPTQTDKGEDPLLGDAKEIVSHYDKVTPSLLQRKLSIGYPRAAKLFDSLVAASVIAQGEGPEPRKVLIKTPNRPSFFPSDLRKLMTRFSNWTLRER